MYWGGSFTSRGFFRRSQLQWQPTLTSHDPNPPITLEDSSASDQNLNPGVYAPGSTIHVPVVQQMAAPRYAKPLNPRVERKSALGRSLIHAWEFSGPDESSAAIVPDIGAYGNARALTITDRVAGSADYVDLRHGRFLDLGLTHRAESTTAPAEQWWANRYFTVELLIRVNDESTTFNPQIGTFWQPINNQNDSVVEFGYNDTWYFGVRDASNQYCFPNGNGVVANGEYVHAILTCNGTNLRFYLNGRLATNGNLNLGTSDGVNSFSTNTAIATGTPGNIGFGSGQVGSVYVNHIGFEISHGRIYNRPLNVAEIAALTNDPWLPLRPATTNVFDVIQVPVLFPHLEPPLYAPGSTIHVPTVTQAAGDQNLNPGVYAPGSTIHVPTITVGAVSLQPGLYAPGSTLHTPTITTGAVSVQPPLYAPGSTIHAPTVTVGAVTVSPGLYVPGSTIYTPTVTVSDASLSPPLYAPGVTIHAPTVSPGAVSLLPGTYAPGSTIFTPQLDLVVQPSVYAPGSTFYTPTVSAGAVALNPPVYAPGSTIHAPTVTAGAVSLQPPLYAPGSTIYAPSVEVGAQTLNPSIYAPGATLHTPTVTTGAVDLQPSLYAPGSTFHAPTVTAGAVSLTVPIYAPGSTIHAPSVAYSVTPGIYSPGSTIHTPTVAVGAVTLSPATYAPGSTIHTPIVTVGAVSLSVPLYAPGSTIYAPTVAADQDLTVPSYAPGSVIYVPTVAVGPITISTPIHVPGVTFHSATITTGPVDLQVSLFAPGSTIYLPTVFVPGSTIPQLIPLVGAPVLLDATSLVPQLSASDVDSPNVVAVGGPTASASTQNLVPRTPTVVE